MKTIENIYIYLIGQITLLKCNLVKRVVLCSDCGFVGNSLDMVGSRKE
jgi:hypothetical protein